VGVMVGELVEDDKDKGSDVLDINSLGMEVGIGGDPVRVVNIREEGRVRGSHELLLGGSEVTLEGVRNDLLRLPNVF
jgi:hypothetical protein